MRGKINNRQLLYVFLGLLGLAVLLQFTRKGSRSSALPTSLVTIDSASVTGLRLKGSEGGVTQEIEMEKKEGVWKLKAGGQWVDVAEGRAEGLVQQLAAITPARLATTKKEKWSDFQVDSAGKQVTVLQGTATVADLIIGRISMRSQREIYSYLRRAGEDAVYSVPGYLAFSVQTDPAAWRNVHMLKTDVSNITSINLVYPADTGFVLTKRDGSWFVGDAAADSAAVREYLNIFGYLAHRHFADDVAPASVGPAAFTLTLTTGAGEQMRLTAHQHPTYGYLLVSSQSPNMVFAGNQDGIMGKIFVGREILLKK